MTQITTIRAMLVNTQTGEVRELTQDQEPTDENRSQLEQQAGAAADQLNLTEQGWEGLVIEFQTISQPSSVSSQPAPEVKILYTEQYQPPEDPQ